MKNVQYPPGPDNKSDGLWFHTECQNGSPHDSKQYVNTMKNFLDCLMAKSSLCVSMSHIYNQVDLDKHFKLQRDTNIPKARKVILPLHSPLVFHYVINYKDTVFNYYNIHFEFDVGRVTLSPRKLGTRKIDLAYFTVTKGIIYLVNEWLIRKVVDPRKNLGANGVLFLETGCNHFISQVLCASMILVDRVDSSFDCSIDNVCKEILPKVLKATDNGCFGYEHVMETMGDLVFTERRFLRGAMVPKLSEEDLAYYQRNDQLYIYPLAGGLSKTKFAHVKFEDKPEQLVTGILELSGWKAKHNNQTCVTRFLQYDVNSQQEVHQQIFMEHIPYMFREIFVIDPQVVERYTWVQELILYSYLPEMGTIFTPLTEKLAGYLLEKSYDLLLANLLVEFLNDNAVNNYGRGTGELNPAFNHLQGCDFVFHQLLDFETWDCFKTSKSDVKQFNESKNGYQSGFIPPQVVQDQSQNKSNHPHKGTNEERIDTTKGNSKDAGTGDGNQVTQTTMRKQRTNNEHGSTDTRNTIESEEEVPHWTIPLIKCQVKLTKCPLRTKGTPYSYAFICRLMNVLLKEKDPEILYPIYKSNEQVRYAAGGQFPVQIGEVSRYFFKFFMNYDACPGYNILFRKGKGGQVCLWCLYFQVSPLNKTNPTIRGVSDLVQCYRKERGNCGEVLGSNESKPYPDTAKLVTVEYIATNYSSGGGDASSSEEDG
eukprot:jgi/Psemu1/40188/gm1.40188_g